VNVGQPPSSTDDEALKRSLPRAGTLLLIGIALLPVMFVTMFLHDAWWQRFGGGRRDARGQAHPGVDDTMRTRRYWWKWRP